ncbi:MAG: ROK family protein, partial [Anaerotignum sp.]|nr:ROK family protein [Anaerotignum sp.]
TGVGGGVVLDGHILMGESGVAGEIGHMTIDPYETAVCGCGKKGCLEQYASATGMVRATERFLKEKKYSFCSARKRCSFCQRPLGCSKGRRCPGK